jgi:hypothetical protein
MENVEQSSAIKQIASRHKRIVVALFFQRHIFCTMVNNAAATRHVANSSLYPSL